jgi:nitrite reductase (NADH) large subunit
MPRLIVIGNGVAGVTTARYVAESDPSIDISIYSQEPYPYYPRPRLIDLLAGKVRAEEMAFYPPDWYEQREIHTALDRRAIEVDPRGQRVVFDDGSSEAYDRLLLATGAHSWIPPIDGADTDGVFSLRTIADALAILQRLSETQRAVVLGGGLLGLDTSAALRARGVDVSVVEMLPWLLPRQLDQEGAAVLERAIEGNGIEIITGDLCTRIDGPDRVRRIHLKSGSRIDAEMVIVSAGVRPNIELAKKAGLACNRGVRVDDRLQTSDPHIYAVGDVTEFGPVLWCIIPAALSQARVAAAQIVADLQGKSASLLYEDIVPSTTLKVTGIDLTSIGEVNPDGEGYTELRQVSEEESIYRKLVLKNGRIVGAILLGDRSDIGAVNRLISREIDVSQYVDKLLDPEFDMMGLVRAAV